MLVIHIHDEFNLLVFMEITVVDKLISAEGEIFEGMLQ